MKTETPRTDELRDSLMLLVGRTSVTYHVEQLLEHSKQLERELNETNDKLTAALMLCADNGINVKSITVAAQPNVVREPSRTHDVKQPET